MAERAAPALFDRGAELARLVRFGLVGIANTAVGASVVVLLQAGLRLDPFSSNAGGILVGLGVGFMLNARFVFKGRGQPGLFTRYVGAFVLAFVLEQLVLAALLYNPVLRVPPFVGQGVALTFYSSAYFLLCRFWVFAPCGAARARPVLPPGTDHSASFAALRASLIDRDGRRYVDFVRGLRPDFRRVRRDIVIGYALLTVSAALMVGMVRLGLPAAATLPIGAILVGYWVAYLQLFLHEGAHYNLAPTRAASDRICNLSIGWMTGTSAARYRIVHFQHHRSLGRRDDSENTYFSPLDISFIVKTLFGLRAAEVILARRRLVDAAPVVKKPDGDEAGRALLIGGISAHLAIVAALYALGGVAAALAWVIGVGMVFPFLGALRQLLEHRDSAADPRTDYRQADHGALTRLFGDGLFASTFGGAGFNRHLLHHWEPQVSYTNLPALERFLLNTSMRSAIEARRSTYAGAFISLTRSASRRA